MHKRFITVHIAAVMPLGNLNRDQNGLPKSGFDGGVQRGRISAQALKRAARVAYRDLGHDESLRTRLAVDVALQEATAYAEEQALAFDAKAGRAAISKVIKALTNSKPETSAKQTDEDGGESKPETDSENIIFISRAELTTLAHAVVNAQHGGDVVSVESSLIRDASSPSLDIAAFGRMFAAQADLGTHAAIAVSHAVTTHQMTLIADYFTAVEDVKQEHAGAAHIGTSYFTSGVYYRTFTVDIDQLARSWSGISGEGARKALGDLTRCLVRALPSGKATNTNPYTTPFLVLAETQDFRTAYEFDAPVQPGEGEGNDYDIDRGGFKTGTTKRIAEQRSRATSFDPDNFGPAVTWLEKPETVSFDDGVTSVPDLAAIVDFVCDQALADVR